MKTIRWRRVWLAIMVGYLVLLIGGTLIGQYLAYQQPKLEWEYMPYIEAHYDKDG
jgi:hypothetical protein